jgi:hypothetical protein
MNDDVRRELLDAGLIPEAPDDIREDIERRDRELRGWMSKGTRPRRTISLAMALHEILKTLPREDYMEAWTTLHEFAWDHYDTVEAAKAIFDAVEVPEDEKRVKHRLAFGGGWEDVHQPGDVQYAPGDGQDGGSGGSGAVPPF